MRRIAVAAVRLLTVDETALPADVTGCIVRLQPSADVDENQLRIKASELRQHALVVKVLPRPASDKLVVNSGNPGVTQLPTNARAFVLDLVSTSSSQRVPEMLEYVVSLADKVGI